MLRPDAPLFFMECVKVPNQPEPKVRHYKEMFATTLIGDPSREVFTCDLFTQKDIDVALPRFREFLEWRTGKGHKSLTIVWDARRVDAYFSSSALPFTALDLDFQSFYCGMRVFLDLPSLPFVNLGVQTAEQFKELVLLQARFVEIVVEAWRAQLLTKPLNEEHLQELPVLASKLSASRFV